MYKLSTRIRLLIAISALLSLPVASLTRNVIAQTELDSAPEKSPNRPIKDKWAVVIGVSKFANPKIPQLKYPSKDANDFYQYLISDGKFAKDHVLLLTDENATKVKILDAFGDGWLPRRVFPDDMVVIFISSHGSSADAAGENFIIAHDSDPNHPYATGIRLQDLSSEITKRTGCERVVLLLDACHSGAATAGAKGMQRTVSNFDLEKLAGVGQLIISSSQRDEVSWESKRYPNSVFTHNLIEALKSQGQQTKLAEAYSNLKQSVEQEVRFDRLASQVPVMISKWNGDSISISAPPSEPRKVLAEIKDDLLDAPPTPSTPTRNVVKLAAGSTPAKPTALVTAPIQNAVSTGSSTITNASSLSQLNMMRTHWGSNGGDATLEAGTRILTQSELAGLSKNDLLYLYNEAYARHGRGFLMKPIQSYFNSQSWYKLDPDYHYRPDDPKVVARGTDDSLVINEKRTPKQWANMQTIKREMNSRKN